ncbi:hypothetical protein [Novosphingobium resinovorum]|uniref:hypothetical protein n=1 Tax=Novosphingobium resinovorum TaxID=158500 RepID=UPI0012EA4E1C|nr:hypothetical protein [Novosphingobium resinovorum]
MPSLSFISIESGVPIKKLKHLARYGLDADALDFEIDRNHQKAIDDLRGKRLSAYVLAYAYVCKINESLDSYARLDDLTEIAGVRGFEISGELSAISWRSIRSEKLLGAKQWIDRSSAPANIGWDLPALERISGWCKTVICNSQFDSVDYRYLSVRLLASLPLNDMPDYPKKVQTSINRLKFSGILDGWWRPDKDISGKSSDMFFRPQFDL